MLKLKRSNVEVVPWSRSFGASMEHLPNVDRLVSMVFEVLQSELDKHCVQKTSKHSGKVFSVEFFWVNFYLREGCEVAANESKPGFKVSNMCCVWPGEKIFWVLIVTNIYFSDSICYIFPSHVRVVVSRLRRYCCCHARIGLLEIDWSYFFDKLENWSCLVSFCFDYSNSLLF